MMPRLVGFGDWQHCPMPTRLEYMTKSNKQTKQGVRDLNGPNADGRISHNGRRSASCAHHRAPDLTPTHVTTRIVHGDTGDYHDRDAIRTAYFTCCSLCGLELYEND